MKFFNVSDVICINLKSASLEDLFAISIVYDFDFEGLVRWKQTIDRIWFVEKGKNSGVTGTIEGIYYVYSGVAFSHKLGKNQQICVSGQFVGKIELEKRDDALRVLPLKVPKIPTSDSIINLYSEYKKMGLDLKIEKFDRMITKVIEVEILEDNLNKISEYQFLLDEALEIEDYETASVMRDKINNLK